MAVVCTSSSGRVRHMAEAGPEPWPRELRWLVVSPGCGSPATPVLVSPNGARNFSRPSPVLLSLRAAPGLPSLRYAEEIGSQNGIGPVMMMVFEKGAKHSRRPVQPSRKLPKHCRNHERTYGLGHRKGILSRKVTVKRRHEPTGITHATGLSRDASWSDGSPSNCISYHLHWNSLFCFLQTQNKSIRVCR